MLKNIGIIGGGQLGKMLAQAAKTLGFKIIILDPDKDCPARGVADLFFESRFDDLIKLEEFCKNSDVITYEFENIPAYVIEHLEKTYNIPQGHKPLYYAQNRLTEKETVKNLGIDTAPFLHLTSFKELESRYLEIGFPSVLKTLEGGYDGHGQLVLRNLNDLEKARTILDKTPCILEKFIYFQREVSIIATRGLNKEISFFPLGENVHKDNILFSTEVPAKVNAKVEENAKRIAAKLMESLNIYGTLAIEFFLLDDNLLFNEMAPRPHNSGHYTIEGCITSQFEQHIRSITGMTLGNTKLKQPTVMINLLGEKILLMENLTKSACFKDIKAHIYGKKEIRPKRKMGHLTFIDKSLTESLKIWEEFL